MTEFSTSNPRGIPLTPEAKRAAEQQQTRPRLSALERARRRRQVLMVLSTADTAGFGVAGLPVPGLSWTVELAIGSTVTLDAGVVLERVPGGGDLQAYFKVTPPGGAAAVIPGGSGLILTATTSPAMGHASQIYAATVAGFHTFEAWANISSGVGQARGAVGQSWLRGLVL